MKVLLVTMYFPPAGGGGVQRPLKLAQYLPALGIETHVLAPEDPKWVHRDPELHVPTQAWIHRVRYVGPRARKPAEELRRAEGVERALVQAQVTARRLLMPDASVSSTIFRGSSALSSTEFTLEEMARLARSKIPMALP